MSKLFVDEIVHQSSQGSGTITLGASGETVALASGASQTMAVNTPAFSLRKSSDQATVANANTLITWDVATIDTDSGFSNANDTWTVPTGKGGKYFLSLNVGFTYGTRFILYIYVNGANTYELDTNSPNNYTGINLNCIATLNASDVVKTHYYSVTSTGNIRYQNSSNNFVTRFEGFKLIGA